jgi:hypothetical protein
MSILIRWTLLGLLLALVGCASEGNNRRAVYMLLDTSGTYSEELGKANAIINYLLGTLETGESLAIARIDSGSFSEKDILVKATFDDRPSVANRQKRAFRDRLDAFFRDFDPSPHTDIRGGLLQATEYLNETGAGRKYVLIFSDLEEDLEEGHVREFLIPLEGIRVVALNVTKLRSDNIDPREYLDRLDLWEAEVARGGGSWRVMNDLDRLERLLQGA